MSKPKRGGMWLFFLLMQGKVSWPKEYWHELPDRFQSLWYISGGHGIGVNGSRLNKIACLS